MTTNVATLPRPRRNVPPLDERVARYLASALEPGHHVTRVELRQLTVTGDARVERWKVTAATDARELADVVFARALDDAEAHRGLVSYGVVAVEDDGELVGRQLFKVPGGGAGNLSIGESEPANEQGTIAFLQRQCETAHKMGFAAMSSALDHYRRIVDNKDLRTEVLEKNQFKTFEALQILTSETHTRELEITRQRASDARKDQIASSLADLAPVITAKLFGGVAGGGDFMGGPLLKRLLGTMTPDQMATLAGTLTPEQFIVFSELYNVIAPKEPAGGDGGAAPAAAAASSAPPPAPAPPSEPLDGEMIP